jgi:hypothetical protein
MAYPYRVWGEGASSCLISELGGSLSERELRLDACIGDLLSILSEVQFEAPMNEFGNTILSQLLRQCRQPTQYPHTRALVESQTQYT